MSDFFVGEIRLFTFNYPPRDWALCNGNVLNASQNMALFSLLGGQFGGDGQVTFALPDFQGRTPVCSATSSNPPAYNINDKGDYQVGKQNGVEAVTLTQTQTSSHNHPVVGTTANGTSPTPSGGILADTKPNPSSQFDEPTYALVSAPLVPLAPASVQAVGGVAHNNMQPGLVVNFCIATSGIYPSRP